MDIEETLVGFEKRFERMVSFLCVVIGGIFLMFALISILEYTTRSLSYSALAIGFMIFPLAASRVLNMDEPKPFPPPLISKKKK